MKFLHADDLDRLADRCKKAGAWPLDHAPGKVVVHQNGSELAPFFGVGKGWAVHVDWRSKTESTTLAARRALELSAARFKAVQAARITWDQIEAANPNWFDPDALRFFLSRVHRKLYRGPGGTYFVSSERNKFGNHLRRYTVHTVGEGLKVDTAGEFQEFASRNGAHSRAKFLAEHGRDS